MNRFITTLFSACCCMLMFLSCDNDSKDISDVAIFIEPSASRPVEINSGDKYRYHIDFYTVHNYVQRLRVSSFDQYNGELSLCDTAWTERAVDYDFVYTAPFSDRDSLRVTLTFRASDDAGSTCEVQRTVIVRSHEVLAGEKSGIVLWRQDGGRPDALGFAEPSKTFSLSASGDSARADMYINADADFAAVQLKSATSARFVRNNSFDYAAATAVSLQAVYAGSRHDDVVDNLRVNDIVLVGHGSVAEGVFRVTNVLRTGPADERCVQLAFKGIL